MRSPCLSVVSLHPPFLLLMAFICIRFFFNVELDVAGSPHSGVVAKLWQYYELQKQIKPDYPDQY